MPYIHIEPKQMTARATMSLVNKMRRSKRIADHSIFTIMVNGCNDWDVTISTDDALDTIECWLNGHQEDYNHYIINNDPVGRI